jgi:hypothetical protein
MFVPFPKPITFPDKAKRWAFLCGRGADFTVSDISRYSSICSKHFAPGSNLNVRENPLLEPFNALWSRQKLSKAMNPRKGRSPDDDSSLVFAAAAAATATSAAITAAAATAAAAALFNQPPRQMEAEDQELRPNLVTYPPSDHPRPPAAVPYIPVEFLSDPGIFPIKTVSVINIKLIIPSQYQ